MARLEQLVVRVYSDVAGKPYIKVEGFDDPDLAASVEMTIWADELVLEDLRRTE